MNMTGVSVEIKPDILKNIISQKRLIVNERGVISVPRIYPDVSGGRQVFFCCVRQVFFCCVA